MKLLAIAAAMSMALYNPAQVNCLTQAVYHEARGESVLGQQAVAWVVVNRANSDRFPNSMCEVISQVDPVKQFSWYGDAAAPVDAEAWAKALAVANYVYLVEPYQNDPTKGALFFHADSIKNPWPKLKKTATIGNHVFYKG